jgi:hypothetical protein
MQKAEIAAEPAESDPAEEIKAKIEGLKTQIAAQVRGDSRAFSALTPEDVLVEMDDDLRRCRIDIYVILSEMVAEDRYIDIKTVTTATELVYAYSDIYITPDDAAVKSLIEEAKSILASAIRADSRDHVKLTPVGEMYAMAPDTERILIDAVLKVMESEATYADIKSVASSTGNLYFHSDKHLTQSYAVTLMMSMNGDKCGASAETVREESNIYPRTTSVATFCEQQVYGIPPQ